MTYHFQSRRVIGIIKFRHQNPVHTNGLYPIPGIRDPPLKVVTLSGNRARIFFIRAPKKKNGVQICARGQASFQFTKCEWGLNTAAKKVGKALASRGQSCYAIFTSP